MTVDDHAYIGDRLRREREGRGFTLRELACRLDVSASLLSQVENNKTRPSVRTLYGIVRELGLSLDDIFGAGGLGNVVDTARGEVASVVRSRQGGGHVLRASDRPYLNLEEDVRWERLTARTEPGIECLYLVYAAGAESAPANALSRHSGREFGIVLSGNLGVTVGFDDYALAAGDSIFFASSIPHRLYNTNHERLKQYG